MSDITQTVDQMISKEIAKEYAMAVPANRVVWNQPAVHGTIGAIHNTLVQSLTLGCRARGGNITTDNVGFKNLLNIKRLARRRILTCDGSKVR